MADYTFRLQPCSIVSYDPLISGMCDAVVRLADGSTLAVASAEVHTADGRPAFRDRTAVRHDADVRTLQDLHAIRAKLIADWRQPWPGAEYGKAIIGQAIDGAIDQVSVRLGKER